MNRMVKSHLKPPKWVVYNNYNIKPWGVYTSIDCFNCNKNTIISENHIRNYVLELCDKIKITPFGHCNIIKSGTYEKEGYSMFQLSDKSNISGHFIDENDKLFIDVFSNKEYDPYEVIKFTIKYFDAKTYIFNVNNRY
jgi:S-adenosylmethionine/arginine decarboxylase-like enzyme